MTYHSLVYLKAVIGHEEKRLNDEPDATAKSSGLSQTGSEPQLLDDVAARYVNLPALVRLLNNRGSRS